VTFLGPRANAELVPKFHIALHALHAALLIVTFKISPYSNVNLTFDLILDWITFFMEDKGEGILHKDDRK
jgi:hypothetical protein